MANWWDSYLTDTPSYLDLGLTDFSSPSTQIDLSNSSPQTSWWDSVANYNENPTVNWWDTPQYNTNVTSDPAPASSNLLDSITSLLSGALSGAGGTAGGTSSGLTLAQLLGAGIPAGLGALASSNQTDALTSLADKYSAMGQPYRDKLSALYADPSTFLNSDAVRIPVQQGTDMLARSLSTRGNPTGSGNALTELQKYSSGQLYDRLGQEKDRLAGFGGLSAYSGAAPQAATNAINSSANTYNAIGAGAADIFTPKQNTLADLIKQMSGG